ncbi:unnamed protein product, partial [Polarella glacialis]
FIAVYDPVITRWHKRTRLAPEKDGIFVARDPINNLPVDLSCLTFADDLFRIGVAVKSEAAIKRIKAWDFCLDLELAKRGLGQNRTKRQVLYSPYGKRASIYLQHFADSPVCQPPLGRLCKSAIYLGSILQQDDRNTLEVSQRIQKAELAWRSMGRFWSEGKISLRIRRMIYLTVVRSILVSGLTALVLSPSEVCPRFFLRSKHSVSLGSRASLVFRGRMSHC